ncbi:MAG: prenyltransferase [Elusimicrobia bacterium]|nr:prenyltransferase [Elusimicrobiota bacterium]
MLRLFRYRFFLFAGGLPYLLGAACAHYELGVFSLNYFLIGLAGIVFSVIGVETFNEYFDAFYGTDRIFSLQPKEKAKTFILSAGIISFFLALAVAVLLVKLRGLPVMAFAFGGFLAAAFYEGPPIRWAYLGLGETMIFLAYGPWMTMGSFYVQAQTVTFTSFLASLVPGLLVWALALANEIPDVYQDRLAGKKNLIVRFGPQRGCFFYHLAALLALLILSLGAAGGVFPKISLAALPSWLFILKRLPQAKETCGHPKLFVPNVRAIMLCYLTTAAIFTLSFLF